MFDRIVVVDWSANSTPKVGRDSIWICVREGRTVETENISTRHAAAGMLDELVGRPGRTLIGTDFSLGYPAGTAAALGLTGVPWSATWDLLAASIRDDERNHNNRFGVAAELNRRISGAATPFWGCPPTQRCPTLASTKSDPTPLREWRSVEQVLRTRGRRPFSSWQLLGVGSVGSQSLVGIPVLRRLRAAHEGVIDVWPFTSGLSVPERRVVLAEVWPSLVDGRAGGDRVRDEMQVETLADWLADRDTENGDIEALFEPDVRASDRSAVVREEGWVLGA